MHGERGIARIAGSFCSPSDYIRRSESGIVLRGVVTDESSKYQVRLGRCSVKRDRWKADRRASRIPRPHLRILLDGTLLRNVDANIVKRE